MLCQTDFSKSRRLSLNHYAKVLVMFSLLSHFPTPTLTFADNVTSGTPDTSRVQQIRSTLEANLYSFNPYVQHHYALRLYRITGDDKYLYPIITDMMVLAQILQQDIAKLDKPEYRHERTQLILQRFNPDKSKQRQRRDLLSQNGDLAFDLALLANLNMLNEVKLLETDFFPNTSRGIEYLKKRDFSRFFLDEEVIKIYSPQLATYVFFLYDLGIADLREPFIKTFRTVFADHLDAGLSSLQYQQKLYGLTHIIIGASRNYQQQVDKAMYDWIYDYFSENIDEITARATEDIIAEVGIAYLLADDKEAPALKKIKRRIASAIRDDIGIIPSPSGSADLESGEHRNVLAIMLFSWPEQLSAGPDLKNSPVYQRFWLRDYLP